MTVDDRRKMFERHAGRFAEGYFTRKSERVLKFPAKPGGGIADKPVVFADGFNDPMDGTMAGVMAYDGVVYLACIPKVLGLVDRDDDGKADERRVVADGLTRVVSPTEIRSSSPPKSTRSTLPPPRVSPLYNAAVA